MPYPRARHADIEFFHSHGWIVVTDAIDADDLITLVTRCEEILRNKDRMASDWLWEKGTSRDDRDFKIVQAHPTMRWPELNDTRVRRWAVEFASALMGDRVEFWYDQFLAKPPNAGGATPWHQDEAYWGRNLDDAGITCWMPFHDVDERNGCMHFIDRGHRDGVLEHSRPMHLQSDLLCCGPDESRAVACPVPLGAVTFHHSKTPHMTTANVTDAWRKVLTQHLRRVGIVAEGDHYPWRIRVDQLAGDRDA
jgi:phytanoyl-CoA hydroxylase